MIYVAFGAPWTMLTSHFKGSFLCLVLGFLLVYVENVVSSSGLISIYEFINFHTYEIICIVYNFRQT